MRFVQPDTVRIDLANGDWIEIKKELTVGEDKRYRTAGLKRMAPATSTQRGEVDVDWAAMAFGRVCAYLVDWSAKDLNGKAVKITPATVESLVKADFEAIDDAILKYIEERDAEKNEPSPAPMTSATSISG